MAKRTKYKPGDIILVHWFDAWHAGHQEGDLEELTRSNPLLVLHQVGFFMDEKGGYVRQAHERTPDKSGFRFVHAIPRVNIISIEVLKECPLKKT